MAPEDKEWAYYHGSGHYQNDGVDPHEEPFLDLPELNKQQIDNNKYNILQNRIMIVSFFTLLLTLNIGGIIVLKHDMHDCQERTAKHIMGDAYVPVFKEKK